MTLSDKIRQELIDRACSAELCKKYFLDWVMQQFRNGENPVQLRCTDCIANIHWETREDRQELISVIGVLPDNYAKLKYDSGYLFILHNGVWYDITHTHIAQKYVPNGVCESDKTRFLEMEGFQCCKQWVYGIGDVINITL